MNDKSPEQVSDPEEDASGSGVAAAAGVSPYATGGGGVTFERRVAVQYLAHLLVGDGASELGDDCQVVSVAFQQAPGQPVDDLVVSAARRGELQPSLELALGVRRSPKLVLSNEPTRELIRQFVSAVTNAPTEGPDLRLGLVVAGPQPHAEQLAHLAGLATAQMDAPGFFSLVRTPGRVNAGIRKRLDHLEELVERALHDLGVPEADTSLAQQRVWQVLARLTVCMPRLESPDETDWAALKNSLIPVARGSDLTGASRLRDRLVELTSEYSPKSARVDIDLLRRDAHATLDSTTRRHQAGWRTLDRLHDSALASVSDEITSSDDARRVRLDRRTSAEELLATAAGAPAVVVSGESGVGKSALALLGLTAAATDPVSMQVLCINLRQVPKLTVQFEDTLDCPLSTLLSELSAPQRMLIVDGADAVAEGWGDAFRHLVGAAQESEVKVIAITSVDSKRVVQDALTKRFSSGVADHTVLPLVDAEIEEIIKTFGELSKLFANPRSRELLRRLVVVDLLVRGRVRNVPLSDADAMREVWSGLVRRHELPVRGFPDARELVLLRLADLSLSDVDAARRMDVISRFDDKALAGLRQDGLLRTSSDNLFLIGPDFAHDAVRRYAVARFLLADRTPASSVMIAGAPRWSLGAARLACQELLAEPDTPTTPLRGRFDALQASFNAVVKAGHGARWGDVPSEALVTIANPDAVLRDAWPGLLADAASGLKRLARVVDQRLRDKNNIVEVTAVEPIITLLLEDHAPWRSGEHAQGLLRAWLQGQVVARTGAGDPLRILLRKRLVEACAEADRRLAEEQKAAEAARIPEQIDQERRIMESNSRFLSEISGDGPSRRQRAELADEITDEIVVELLALLGPDLGYEGEAILCRVAQHAPSWLAPAVEEFFCGYALTGYRRGLLARLTEAYYLDDETADFIIHDFNFGIRSHHTRSFGSGPLAAWYFGPFMPLFRSDFRNGVAVLNRLLDHAARIRARTLAGLGRMGQPLEDHDFGPYETELEIAGARKVYVGDEHVWRWHRGSGVGPYPCISALQALEHACEELIEAGTPIETLISILLDGCENLAMVGLVVGLLVRHLEDAGRLLDPYLAEPVIWLQEFARVANETQRFAVDSEKLVAPDRREWSLRSAAMFMCVRANPERAAELRALGETLVANARLQIESASSDESTAPKADSEDSIEQQLVTVRAWASSLDCDSYQAHEAPDGMYIQSTPPDDIVRALQPGNEDLERVQESTRLVVRYSIKPIEKPAADVGVDELAADLASSRKLFESPPSQRIHDPWDVSALVAAAALEASLLGVADLPDEALSFATETVLRVGEGETGPRHYEMEQTLFGQGSDRSAARALPLLLLPAAAPLRAIVDKADGWTTFNRAARAGVELAHGVAGEVRLHLGRGLDHVWEAPCVENRSCHHEIGLRLATETMRDCVLSAWDPDTGRRTVVALEEPITQSLANADDDSIIAFRLDAAIRALAPAASANICVSERARVLLLALLAAQRRALLSAKRNEMDARGSHTLVSARALLTLAQRGDDATIHEHIDAFAGNSALLDTFLRALSAAAEETPDRAATARRIWPKVVRHVLDLKGSGHAPLQDHHYGNMALAALMPEPASEIKYLYREVQESPIAWWEPLAVRSEVEAWLPIAAGRAECVDQLIGFLGVLASEDQVVIGLPWIARLVLTDPARIAGRSFLLPTWLIDRHAAAEKAGRLASWQEVVDALVVAGVTQLAPYSE